MSWNAHINKIFSKLSRAMGILNKLKNFLPIHIKILLYNSLILPHLNYNILLWGHRSHKIFKLQKRIIRTITCSKYNAHTDNLFKQLKLLKVEDIHLLFKYKFYYKYCNSSLPEFFEKLEFLKRSDIHDYNTRRQQDLDIPRIKHDFASFTLVYSIPKLVNNAPVSILSKVGTHSLQGFSNYIKQHLWNQYSETCTIQNCYVCNN